MAQQAGDRGQSAPQRLLSGKFLLTYREKRGKEKRGKGVKRGGRKIAHGKIWNGSRKSYKMRWGLFLLFTFENDGNLFWVYHNGNFLPGKNISRRENNQEKWLCPLRKICLLCPWFSHACFMNQKQMAVSTCYIMIYRMHKLFDFYTGIHIWLGQFGHSKTIYNDIQGSDYEYNYINKKIFRIFRNIQ